jgi:glycine/serine hydroxymethyltransferase
MDPVTYVLVSVIGLVGVLGVALLGAFVGRRKLKADTATATADAADKITHAAERLVIIADARVVAMQADIAEVRRNDAMCQARLTVAEAQIAALTAALQAGQLHPLPVVTGTTTHTTSTSITEPAPA